MMSRSLSEFTLVTKAIARRNAGINSRSQRGHLTLTKWCSVALGGNVLLRCRTAALFGGFAAYPSTSPRPGLPLRSTGQALDRAQNTAYEDVDATIARSCSDNSVSALTPRALLQ